MDFPVSISSLALEAISDGCIIFDHSGKVSQVNAQAGRLLKRSRKKIIGLTPDAIFSASMAHEIQSALSHDGTVVQVASFDANLDGVENGHLSSCRLAPCQEGLILLIHDCAELSSVLAEKNELEAELNELKITIQLSQELLRSNNERLNQSLERLQSMNLELERSARLRSEFLTTTSHELRTPLNGIIGALQLIVEGLCDDEDEQQEFTSNALGNARHLLSIINEVLDISKIEAGNVELMIEHIDVRSLFNDLRVKLKSKAEKAGLELMFNIADSESTIVQSDLHKVGIILQLLIDNAIKFTQEGIIHVRLDPYPGEDEYMVFSVQDSGIGIPDKYHESVFEKFFQVDGSATRKHGGAGLGLSLAKALVLILDGQIWIRKESGQVKGATLCFTQPTPDHPNPKPTRTEHDFDIAIEAFDDSF